MERKPVSEARDDLAETLNRVCYKGERIVLHRRGKNVAALVPVEDLELLEELEDRIDLEIAREALKEAEKEGTISWSEVKKKLGL